MLESGQTDVFTQNVSVLLVTMRVTAQVKFPYCWSGIEYRFVLFKTCQLFSLDLRLGRGKHTIKSLSWCTETYIVQAVKPNPFSEYCLFMSCWLWVCLLCSQICSNKKMWLLTVWQVASWKLTTIFSLSCRSWLTLKPLNRPWMRLSLGTMRSLS